MAFHGCREVHFCCTVQIFDRDAEISYLFPGKNNFPVANTKPDPKQHSVEDTSKIAVHPIVLFAPVGSGKTTILQKGSTTQPDTLLCSLRSNERSASADAAEFVHQFTESIGLLPRDSGWVAFVDSVASTNFRTLFVWQPSTNLINSAPDFRFFRRAIFRN
jgi:hypothetical protein